MGSAIPILTFKIRECARWNVLVICHTDSLYKHTIKLYWNNRFRMYLLSYLDTLLSGLDKHPRNLWPFHHYSWSHPYSLLQSIYTYINMRVFFIEIMSYFSEILSKIHTLPGLVTVHWLHGGNEQSCVGKPKPFALQSPNCIFLHLNTRWKSSYLAPRGSTPVTTFISGYIESASGSNFPLLKADVICGAHDSGTFAPMVRNTCFSYLVRAATIPYKYEFSCAVKRLSYLTYAHLLHSSLQKAH